MSGDYVHMTNRIDELEAENKKLLKIARAAAAYLESRFWDEDDTEECGEALADAMNEWKGITRKC